MYWADWGVEPKIERARLDGSDRTVLLNTSIRAPFGLSLDRPSNCLYWCDQQLKKLAVLNLTSIESRDLVMNVSDCAGVAVLDDFVYWADLLVVVVPRPSFWKWSLWPEPTFFKLLRKDFLPFENL